MFKWLIKLRCTHRWEEFHPLSYQPYVLMKKCILCTQLYNEGVRGESRQIIPYGFHATTKQPLFGASFPKNLKAAGR